MVYTFVIAAVFKNEGHILKEWIEHYLRWGAEHFYLVNDFSTDNYLEILDLYQDKVTLFHNDIVTKESGRQPMIYNRYFKDIPSEWVAILDLDEFMYSQTHKDIKTFLNEQKENQIKADWLHFGSSKFIEQPESVVNSFTFRAKFDTTKPYYSYKTMYRTKELTGFGVHGHRVNGKTYHAPHNELVINHYPLQSFNFFMKVKTTRGDVNNWFDQTGRKRDLHYFKQQDINEIEDTTLMKLNLILLK
jgi:glycosyltransferase involved in cell wall biosynthesis